MTETSGTIDKSLPLDNRNHQMFRHRDFGGLLRGWLFERTFALL
jgi:hypothetical protein